MPPFDKNKKGAIIFKNKWLDNRSCKKGESQPINTRVLTATTPAALEQNICYKAKAISQGMI